MTCEFTWPDVFPGTRRMCHGKAVSKYENRFCCPAHIRTFKKCDNEEWHDFRNILYEPCPSCGEKP